MGVGVGGGGVVLYITFASVEHAVCEGECLFFFNACQLIEYFIWLNTLLRCQISILNLCNIRETKSDIVI